jgi:hypothetical protein
MYWNPSEATCWNRVLFNSGVVWPGMISIEPFQAYFLQDDLLEYPEITQKEGDL